jgi:hypothetical protein
MLNTKENISFLIKIKMVIFIDLRNIYKMLLSV